MLKSENFHINLRQLLNELGLSQVEFAERIGCTQAAVSQLLNAERLPSMETLLKIINTFHIKFERLFR